MENSNKKNGTKVNGSKPTLALSPCYVKADPSLTDKENEKIAEIVTKPKSQENIEKLIALYKELGITGCSF